jgi:hypothetical protein
MISGCLSRSSRLKGTSSIGFATRSETQSGRMARFSSRPEGRVSVFARANRKKEDSKLRAIAATDRMSLKWVVDSRSHPGKCIVRSAFRWHGSRSRPSVRASVLTGVQRMRQHNGAVCFYCRVPHNPCKGGIPGKSSQIETILRTTGDPSLAQVARGKGTSAVGCVRAPAREWAAGTAWGCDSSSRRTTQTPDSSAAGT